MCDTVACYSLRVDAFDGHLARLLALLDAAELERYERFVHTGAQRTFLVARAALRIVLAAHLQCDAAAIALAYGPAGKPFVEGSAVRFNLAHSGGVVVLAFAHRVEVGVDVERVQPMRERAEIARRFFHPEEARELSSLSGTEAERAFYRCWTRKEAVAKALGLGLSLPLDSYRVSCRPDEAARLRSVAADMPNSDRWTLGDLPLDDGFVGAFAAPRAALRLIHRTLDAPTLLAPSVLIDVLGIREWFGRVDFEIE